MCTCCRSSGDSVEQVSDQAIVLLHSKHAEHHGEQERVGAPFRFDLAHESDNPVAQLRPFEAIEEHRDLVDRELDSALAKGDSRLASESAEPLADLSFFGGGHLNVLRSVGTRCEYIELPSVARSGRESHAIVGRSIFRSKAECPAMRRFGSGPR